MRYDLLNMSVEKSKLRRLHNTHKEIYENGSYQRQFGKTFYFVNILKGYLEVLENEEIIVILENKNRVKEFVDMLFELDDVSILEPKFKKNISKIDFKNNSNKVFFKFRNDGKDIFEQLIGTNIRNITPICDLNDLPSSFYKELNEYSERALYYMKNYKDTFIFDMENSTTTVTQHYANINYFGNPINLSHVSFL